LKGATIPTGLAKVDFFFGGIGGATLLLFGTAPSCFGLPKFSLVGLKLILQKILY